MGQDEVQQRMDALGHPEALVQRTGSRTLLVRTKVLGEDASAGRSERQTIEDDLTQNVAPVVAVNFDSTSPIVAQETVRTAIIALAAASVFILLYIWYAFRRVPQGLPLRHQRHPYPHSRHPAGGSASSPSWGGC